MKTSPAKRSPDRVERALESAPPQIVDRLALRGRPAGFPMLTQDWEDLLFMHWPVDPTALRPLLPTRLSLDLFEGQAWVTVTPFTLTHLRPVRFPRIPGTSRFHELNVRTYVHCEGVPGVWFFSLDASKLIPVLGARAIYALPYKKARMTARSDGENFEYRSRRVGGAASFFARWTVRSPLPTPAVDSLLFFLVERYCLFAVQRRRLFSCRIYHVPWRLNGVELLDYDSSMIAAAGLSEPAARPILHAGTMRNIEIWPLQPVD